MFNIIIVDDEEEILELMEVYLKNDGYKVFKANNGYDALKIIDIEKIHLVILDIMMEEIDGLQVCRKIREKYNIPIIMLSAKSQDIDKITGLSIGCDDYMVKPFNPMELLARVKAQIRRYVYFNENSMLKERKDIIEIQGLSINKKSHSVYLYDREIKLTPTEYEILLLLANEKGRVFNSEEIYQTIWKEKYYEGNNTVMSHIWRLREKIEVNPKDPKILKTVWGVGYKIEE